jgi:methyl-accepting chemotaxis protein
MLTWLRSWFFPAYPDEDLNRRARLLNVMTAVALFFALLVNAALIVSTIQLRQWGSTVTAAGTVAVCLIWIGAIAVLSRRGRIGAGSHVLLWGGMVIATLSNVTDPNSGLVDPSWYLLLIIVVAASLLLGTRWGIIVAIVETLVYVASALASLAGYIPRTIPRPPDNIPYAIAMTGGTLIVLSVLGWFFGSGLERALKRAQQQAAELAEAKVHLERTQAYLEQTVERTVAEYTAFAQRVAAGDLASRLDLAAEESNPMLALGRSLNAMVEGLQRISAQVHVAVRNLTAVAGGIQSICGQQATGAGQQSVAISDATATITEVRVITEQTAGRADGVASLARQTAEVSRSGEQAVSDTVAGMGQVKDRVGEIASHILTLAEQMQAIGQIITTVNEVATRSKLLALNAAVEAARAGEAGKSFAVVAGEMRSLAEQSRAATERVSLIITELQEEVSAAAQATEEGVRRADAGVQLAGRAGEAIRKLAEGVDESAHAAMQIAAAAGQQMTGMEQIAGAMENIQQVTAQGLTSTRQAEQSAGELNQLADRLREIVAQYRL